MHLAHILRLRNLASHRSQVAIQGAAEELEQHLEADAGESWVVAAPEMLSVFRDLHVVGSAWGKYTSTARRE